MGRKDHKESAATRPALRPYKVPVLVEYGDVRQLTQGGTAGTIEIANNSTNFMD